MLDSGVVPDGRLSPPLFELVADRGRDRRGAGRSATVSRSRSSGRRASSRSSSRSGSRRDPVTDQIVQLVSSEFGGRLEQLRLLEALGEQTLRDALTGVGSRRHADALVDGSATRRLAAADRRRPLQGRQRHARPSRRRPVARAARRAPARRPARPRQRRPLRRRRVPRAAAHARRRFGATSRAGCSTRGSRPATSRRSVSVSPSHERGVDPQVTFAEADRALYVSKREGRARIAVA